jgi:ribosomal protein S18 acetylase RimI-like enzyme
MTEWRLRRASDDDAAAAALVAGATFLDTFAGILAGSDIVAHVARKSSPAQFTAWATDPDSAVTLAEHGAGGAPVGYSVLTAPDLPGEHGPDDIELRRIYAMSRFHGAGLGPALMARAVADARALGKTWLWLGVLASNVRARRFYERQGFALAGERQFLVGATWFDDVVYARPL